MEIYEWERLMQRFDRLEKMLHELKKQGENTMSALDDKTAAIQAALAQLKTDLETALADLKAQIAAGGPTEAQLAALDDIVASINAIDTEAKNEGNPPVNP